MGGLENLYCPGEVLGLESEYISGTGTHTRGHHICASLVGVKTVVPPSDDAKDKRPVVKIVRGREQLVFPEPGSTVTAKVAKVNPRMAHVDILCVGPRAVSDKFSGIIRQQDVRATEIDKVDLFLSFRPGDLVRAEVISLGDSRAYYLSTAKNELGVVHATSVAGEAMVPINWQEMQCPVTGATEFRKVAKTR